MNSTTDLLLIFNGRNCTENRKARRISSSSTMLLLLHHLTALLTSSFGHGISWIVHGEQLSIGVDILHVVEQHVGDEPMREEFLWHDVHRWTCFDFVGSRLVFGGRHFGSEFSEKIKRLPRLRITVECFSSRTRPNLPEILWNSNGCYDSSCCRVACRPSARP